MNNSVFDLNQTFDFSILNLGNPTLANNNNYISKISHGMTSKNLYIQLPKCTTKQGIIKSSSKIYTELNFSISQNVKSVFLEVSKTNHPAIRFYCRHRFVNVGLRKNYYRFSSTNKKDAVIMCLHLQPKRAEI